VRAAEHALELELLDLGAHGVHVARDLGHRGFVLLGFGQLQQIGRIGKPAIEPLELPDDAVELGTLAPQRLGTRRVFPDFGVFQRLLDLGQAFLLAIAVKDTPGARPIARGAGE
jgi:hypothetical protein